MFNESDNSVLNAWHIMCLKGAGSTTHCVQSRVCIFPKSHIPPPFENYICYREAPNINLKFFFLNRGKEMNFWVKSIKNNEKNLLILEFFPPKH